MKNAAQQNDNASQSRQGLVIAAIGLHLFICSIASAAGACGDSLDRSARRIPSQVAQAFREIVERGAYTDPIVHEHAQGFTLQECPISIRPEPQPIYALLQSAWIESQLNLPPPPIA